MAGIWFIDRRTPEERAADEKKRYDGHWLEDGKDYTFEVSKTWYSGWSPFKIMSWSVYIRQGFCPWFILASKSFTYNEAVPFAGSISKAKAEKWGRDYLKRGGPPAGYFAPPPPDPNLITYKAS